MKNKNPTEIISFGDNFAPFDEILYFSPFFNSFLVKQYNFLPPIAACVKSPSFSQKPSSAPIFIFLKFFPAILSVSQ